MATSRLPFTSGLREPSVLSLRLVTGAGCGTLPFRLAYVENACQDLPAVGTTKPSAPAPPITSPGTSQPPRGSWPKRGHSSFPSTSLETAALTIQHWEKPACRFHEKPV
ncbi:hypothetical protein CBOM_04624 [Ceraceosorus bombacis]|uniref:Uncharacterized protein n=1 Tax=Ceraceosorus bombacis TaxID=401625 RepID=A0A0P1BMV9_9BASI|nr:hypothetical protein CBOM_04624 [Ceraceosorus bombacis]